jgi:hypothetical protein
VTPLLDKQVLLNERLDDRRVGAFAASLVAR